MDFEEELRIETSKSLKPPTGPRRSLHPPFSRPVDGSDEIQVAIEAAMARWADALDIPQEVRDWAFTASDSWRRRAEAERRIFVEHVNTILANYLKNLNEQLAPLGITVMYESRQIVPRPETP